MAVNQTDARPSHVPLHSLLTFTIYPASTKNELSIERSTFCNATLCIFDHHGDPTASEQYRMFWSGGSRQLNSPDHSLVLVAQFSKPAKQMDIAGQTVGMDAIPILGNALEDHAAVKLIGDFSSNGAVELGSHRCVVNTRPMQVFFSNFRELDRSGDLEGVEPEDDVLAFLRKRLDAAVEFTPMVQDVSGAVVIVVMLHALGHARLCLIVEVCHDG